VTSANTNKLPISVTTGAVPKMVASIEAPPLNIALIGNPNCGKTTLFNALTGLRYKVGNYPGVTVERREGYACLDGKNFCIIDLPGIYSLDATSLDEHITANVLNGTEGFTRPDAIIYLADATKLERSLYLFEQLRAKKLPMILAITMMDIAPHQGISIKGALLQRKLGVPVVLLSPDNRRNGAELRASLSSAISLQTRAEVIENMTYQAVSDVPKTDVLDTYTPSKRYAAIASLLQGCVTYAPYTPHRFGRILDTIITSNLSGIFCFLLVMSLLFQVVFSLSSYPMGLIDSSVSALGDWLYSLLPPSLFQELLSEGLVPGIGSVLMFIPQIGLLFFMLSLLEESGYLVRAAYLMDSFMRRIGLQGRSFIPLLSSFACAVPGIMATRVIPSPRERLLTILIAPLMSCSARLPVYSLIITAFFPKAMYFGIISLQGLVLFGLYSLGVVAAIILSLILSLTVLKGTPSTLLMEVPDLRIPSVKNALIYTYDRLSIFVQSTGTVILASSILLWGLAHFPGGTMQDSFAGMLGHFVEPLFRPLGFGWEVCIALITSFAAREVFVSSLATLIESSGRHVPGLSALESIRATNFVTFPSAVALLVFFVFACQCFSTIVVAYKETKSWRWPALMFGGMALLAWFCSFFAYNITVWSIS
jgi:ferrous iron transport protein B